MAISISQQSEARETIVGVTPLNGHQHVVLMHTLELQNSTQKIITKKGGHIRVDTKHVGKIRIRIKEVEKLVDIRKKTLNIFHIK